MPKNILIFSDGTGQAGGMAPDQRLSNIYKLYRATRVGPDNNVRPEDQVSFYDPGLGTDSDIGNLRLRLWSSLRKFASSATGAGIGKNIADCYEAILRHYEPGDRIYLFGFSRGAYTVRCVASVLRLCGVPQGLGGEGKPPRHGSGLRAVAEEAVHSVYEHGSGRNREKYRAEREELARRFRLKYASGNEQGPNVSPYFIGVFDTVAALGASGLRRVLMLAALVVGMLAAVAAVAVLLATTGIATFWPAFGWTATAALLIGSVKIAKSRLKVIRHYPKPGSVSFHWTGWRFGNYDTRLDRRVPFARHAIAVDETREDFRRVPWGQPSEGPSLPEPGMPERFRQWWFAGNHSDVGGSYPEDESRLSDVALQWMVEEVTSLPHPILMDESKLNLFPSAAGMQHCEVESMLDSYPRWWPRTLRRSWKAAPRMEASGAPYHESVLERLALPAVQDCGKVGLYRPVALSKDPDLRRYYPDPETSGTGGAPE